MKGLPSVLDEILLSSDVCMHEGEPHVSIPGLVKILLATSFHCPDKAGRAKAVVGRERIIKAARKARYPKVDMMVSAWARPLPASKSAHALVEGLFEHVGSAEVLAALDDRNQ